MLPSGRPRSNWARRVFPPICSATMSRVSVVSSFAQLETAKASIISNQATVRAAEIALMGVREEAKVGQRTTLDVLNAQLALLNARVNLVIAQR